MKFERIDKSNVRCIIDEDDMKRYDVEINDFFTNSERLHNFLHQMVDEAKKEVDYRPKRGVLSMQITMVSEHCLAINLSENEQSLDFLPSVIKDKIQNLTPEEQEEAVSRFMDIMKSETEKQKNVVDVEPSYLRIFSFDCLDDVIHFCATISNRCQIKSSLYKNENRYYLCMERGNASVRNFARTCLRAHDFGHLITDNRNHKSYMEEQYDCIFSEKAVLKLNKIKL